MEALKKLTAQLGELLADEDLDSDKLQAASEGLLPRLHDALIKNGFSYDGEVIG